MPVAFLAFLLALLGFYNAALAKIGQELHIFANGDIQLLNAEIITKHATNLISVDIWGQKWTIPIEYSTAVESAAGTKIKLEELLIGHRLEIRGKPLANKTGWIDARLVRDLEIEAATATPPAQTAAILQAPVFVPSLPPPAVTQQPSQTMPTPGRKLTQYLQAGMHGGEVIILQEFLQKNGWGIPDDGPVTGYFGKVTQGAVMKFQVANGLPPEGVVGPKTRALINALLAKSS